MTLWSHRRRSPVARYRLSGISGIVTLAVSLWLFLLLQADLKITVSPYVHWMATGLLLPVYLLTGLKLKRRVNLLALILLMGVPVGMFVNFVILPGILYDVLLSFKVLLIFAGFIVLYACADQPRLFIRSYVASLAVNLLLLGMGVAGFTLAAGLMTADGRWGTFLNYPGSLTKVGIVVIVYSLYGLLRVQGRRWWHAIVGVGALVVIVSDGSRTAALAVPFAIVFVGGILLNEAGLLRSRRARKAFVGLSLTVIAAIVAFVASGRVEGARVYQSILAVLQGGLSERGLGSADASRFQMLLDGWTAVQRHPFIGSGMGTTTSPTPIGPMTVHNTYLQLWGDAGLLAFVALVSLFLTGMIVAAIVTFQVAGRMRLNERPFVYSQAFVLFYFPFNALFHPFSTEWSEWVIFLSAYATTWYTLSHMRQLTLENRARE